MYCKQILYLRDSRFKHCDTATMHAQKYNYDICSVFLFYLFLPGRPAEEVKQYGLRAYTAVYST